MFKKNIFVYKLNKVKDNKIVLFPHLGLGDHIIVNGIVNYISNHLKKKIYLPVKDNYIDQISYLYSTNQNVDLFEVKNETRNEDVLGFAENNNLKILKIGYEKVKKEPFNTYFYKQLNIPYEHTYDYFSIPTDVPKNEELKKHLLNHYKIGSSNFILIHGESSYEKYDLNISNKLEKIYIDKESDKFNNMFYYEQIIKEAKEIHCVNGSFLHLVERIDTKAKLYYHHLRKNNMYLSKKWEWVTY